MEKKTAEAESALKGVTLDKMQVITGPKMVLSNSLRFAKPSQCRNATAGATKKGKGEIRISNIRSVHCTLVFDDTSPMEDPCPRKVPIRTCLHQQTSNKYPTCTSGNSQRNSHHKIPNKPDPRIMSFQSTVANICQPSTTHLPRFVAP